jgi:catechol 2,3-dioxygenase-like lactoylglutathione lyase family enzyme
MAYGSRWSAHNVVDDVDLYDNYLDGVANGEPWIVHAMTRDYSGPEGDRPGSFDRRFVGFREFSITGPETRQVFISRYRRDRPGYGTNQPPRGVSESTHYGLSTPVDANLDWYTQVLGFTIERRHDITTGSTARFTMELLPGQAVAYTKLASDRAPIGILYHFQPRWIAPDARPWARPGGAGMVAFSFRQPALDGLRADSIAAGCRDVSEIEPNEFGEPSFRLESPDGAVWALVGDE